MSSSNTSIKRPHFRNLDGLRFIAALAVVLFHIVTLNREIWGDFYDSFLFQKFVFLIHKGHLAIIFFFVLSGFLITYILFWEKQVSGKFNFWKYMVRRFLRTWPLYFLVVFFGFWIFPHLPYGIETSHELWRYLFFLSNIDEIIIGGMDPINFLSATWTVSVEEQFYIVWGIVIGAIATSRNQLYYLFFLSIIIGSVCFRLMNLEDHRTLYFHTFSVMSDSAFGATVGLYAFSGRAERFFACLPKRTILISYAIIALLFLFESHIFQGGLFVFARFLPGIAFSFILLEQVYAKNSFFKADRITWIAYSGKITYSFYLFHCIFIYYWGIFFKNMKWTNTLFDFCLFAILVLVSTYILAHWSYNYFEKPILKLKKYFR